MGTVVKKLNITRAPGYLYFINKDGDVARFKRGTKTKSVVKKTSLKKEKGFLYFLDGNGNISRTKMKRR